MPASALVPAVLRPDAPVVGRADCAEAACEPAGLWSRRHGRPPPTERLSGRSRRHVWQEAALGFDPASLVQSLAFAILLANLEVQLQPTQ